MARKTVAILVTVTIKARHTLATDVFVAARVYEAPAMGFMGTHIAFGPVGAAHVLDAIRFVAVLMIWTMLVPSTCTTDVLNAVTGRTVLIFVAFSYFRCQHAGSDERKDKS